MFELWSWWWETHVDEEKTIRVEKADESEILELNGEASDVVWAKLYKKYENEQLYDT